MRASDQILSMPVSRDDIHRERARSPMSRQLCTGSRAQLMVDAEDTVECPKCLREFTEFDKQKNRDRMHPIVPSHMPDREGQMKVEIANTKRRKSETPRPY